MDRRGGDRRDCEHGRAENEQQHQCRQRPPLQQRHAPEREERNVQKRAKEPVDAEQRRIPPAADAGGDGEHAYERSGCASAAPSRKTRFKTFPVGRVGSSDTNSITSGHLNRASDRLQCSRISSSVAVAPGFSTTKALTASPVYGCGTPITATSATFAWRKIASSTSRGYTLNPLTRMRSLIRSTRKM